MKLIVTHKNPDLDAISSVWLVRRFLPEWEQAEVGFVPSGHTWKGEAADSDREILHVDTGMGRLDHHQLSEITSAAQLTWEYILEKRKGQPLSELDEEAVGRIVKVVNEVDNARDLAWKEAGSDRFEFYLHSLIYGLKRTIPDDGELTEQGMILMDALWRLFKDKIRAEELLEEEGVKFQTRWGKAIACRTGNEKVLWEAETKGYVLVIKYDEKIKKRVKIYARFDSRVDLTATAKKLAEVDPRADWFLHASKKLLLISNAPEAKGTELTLEELIELLRKK